jgi:hypothetical protein
MKTNYREIVVCGKQGTALQLATVLVHRCNQNKLNEAKTEIEK